MKPLFGNNLKDEDEKNESVDTLLLDVSFMAHRHAHAMGQRLLTTDGRMVGHIFGAFKQIKSFVGTFRPRRLALVYDRGSSWRRALVPSYKQSRRPPDGAEKQWSPGPEVERLLRSFPGYHLSLDDFEADDMACWFTTNPPDDVKGSILIYSGDRDLWQLINDKAKIAALVTKKPKGPRAKSKNIWVREELVKEEFGVGPRALAKLKALLGDNSDEIHGLRGAVRPGKKDVLRGFADDDLSDVYFDATKQITKDHLPVPEPFQDALLAERQDMLNNYRVVNLNLAQIPSGSNPLKVETGSVAGALDTLVEFECESLLAQVEPLFKDLSR
jgi:5'-3' exonuclease